MARPMGILGTAIAVNRLYIEVNDIGVLQFVEAVLVGCLRALFAAARENLTSSFPTLPFTIAADSLSKMKPRQMNCYNNNTDGAVEYGRHGSSSLDIFDN